jgi:hypothetical protein
MLLKSSSWTKPIHNITSHVLTFLTLKCCALVVNIISLKFIEIFEFQSHKVKLFFINVLIFICGWFFAITLLKQNNVLYPLELVTFWAYWIPEAFTFTKHIIIHGIDPMYVDDTMYVFEIHHLQRHIYIFHTIYNACNSRIT